MYLRPVADLDRCLGLRLVPTLARRTDREADTVTEFTPGPWKWNDNLSYPSFDCMSALEDAAGRTVLLHVANWTIRIPNRDLIAAAPDLYAIAQDIAIVTTARRSEDPEAHAFLDALSEVGPRAVAACARARGEA